MRLLHTSDWHLGQTLLDFDRSYEHQCFLDWLLDTLDNEQIDALLIAGDIFDNPNPSAAAQKQFYRFLSSAKQRLPHLHTVIIAGNHDSPGRLEAPAPLLDELDATPIGYITRDAEQRIELDRLVVPLRNRQGAIAAWCLAIPFLRPGDVPKVDTPGDAYLDGVRALYRQALDQALTRRQADQALIALGHCHMHGGEVSRDSERRIVIGGAEALSVEIFAPDLAYVALGHLHRAQRVGSQERVRYCGSPLPLSFSEIDYRHQVLRIELDGAALREVVALPVPRPVELLRIPAQPALFDDVVLPELQALALPERPHAQQPYLQVRVLKTAPEPGLRARVESALHGKPVRLAGIETHYPSSGPANAERPQSLDELRQLQPDDIFRQLHQRKYTAEPDKALLAAFTELLSGIDIAPESSQ